MTYESMLAETVAFTGHKGDVGEAYYARPLGPGPWPGVVLIHHMPGWDEWINEATRKLAHHGFATIAPHLYFREGPGSPDDVGARVRAAGGVADEQVMGDVKGCDGVLRAQPDSNGKVGVIGFCSGGRHAYPGRLHAPDFDAAVDCWGGNVDRRRPQGAQRQAAGRADRSDRQDEMPAARHLRQRRRESRTGQVNRTEAVLKKLGKNYEFHRYDGAGHAFFNTARASLTGRSRRSMAGPRCSRSSTSISPARPRRARPEEPLS